MTWQQRKLRVGLLALLAPLPLPFNEMASWIGTLAYLVVVSGLVLALQRGKAMLAPAWALNLAGALYFPVLFLDLASAQGGQVLRPLVHVAMFATAAKLFALRTERDKWHAILGAFFLFIAGMGSSVHPALVAHMLMFSSVAVASLIHFVEAHSLRAFPAAEPIPGKTRLTAAVIATTVAGCIVIFPLLPRINQPYVAGGGGVDLGGTGGISAFGGDLTLNSIGRIRTDRGVALRLVFDGPVPAEIRLKGSSYDSYDGDRWLRTQRRRFVRAQSGRVVLADRVPLGEVEVLNRMTGIGMMPILPSVVTVEIDAPVIGVSAGGDLRPARWRGTPLRYRMEYGSNRVSLAAVPPNEETLDTAAVTPAIEQYAQPFFADERSIREQVFALEDHFHSQFSYTLDLDLDRTQPIEDFLLNKQAGHCEYFASSMVLLLRSQGIPARVVSGFLGAEGNPLESFYVVRNSNAHAWVEAYVDGSGWLTVDPTPAAGRPQEGRSEVDWMRKISDVYDWLIYRWDRYILTFSSQDQSSVFASIASWFKELWASWGGVEEDTPIESTVTDAAVQQELSVDETKQPQNGWGWKWLVGLGVLLVVVVWVVFWIYRRRRFTATDVYLRLRSTAPRAGVEMDASDVPGQLLAAWLLRSPDVEQELRSIIGAYLEESFGGRELERLELEQLRDDLRLVVRKLPRAA